MAGTQNTITQAKAAGLKATFIDMRSACSRARLHQKTDGADHCDGCASVRAPIRCYVASVSLSPDVCVCMSIGCLVLMDGSDSGFYRKLTLPIALRLSVVPPAVSRVCVRAQNVVLCVIELCRGCMLCTCVCGAVGPGSRHMRHGTCGGRSSTHHKPARRRAPGPGRGRGGGKG